MTLPGPLDRLPVHALESLRDAGGIETPPQRGARLGGEPAAVRRVRELAERPSELTRIGLDQAPALLSGATSVPADGKTVITL